MRAIQGVVASVVVLLTLFVNSGPVQAEVLYGVSLNGFTSGSPGASSLYSIDSTTGAGTLVGTTLGYAVNAIAVDPTTGIMYGSTTTWSGTFNGLLEIDRTTGTATEIGSFGDVDFFAILGLTFDSSGNLFGWHDPFEDDAVTINKATGAATELGDSGIGTGGHVLAFDGNDNLTLVQDFTIFNVNTTTGTANGTGILSFDPGQGGSAFDSTGRLWAPRNFAFVEDSFIRVTDLADNSFIDINTDVEFLSAVTWASEAAPVPEPASMTLVGIAALGMAFGAIRRRRRANQAADV